MNDDLYRQQIIEHFRKPLNTKSIEGSTLTAKTENTNCGDESQMWVKIKDGKIEEIAHQTVGCAICVAGASLVSEYVKGKNISQVAKLTIEDVKKLAGIEITRAREKCLILGLKSLQQAIKKA